MKKLGKIIKYNYSLSLYLLAGQIMFSLFAVPTLTIELDSLNEFVRYGMGVAYIFSILAYMFSFVKKSAYDDFMQSLSNQSRKQRGDFIDEKRLYKQYYRYKGYIIGLIAMLPLLSFAMFGNPTDNIAIGLVNLLLCGYIVLPLTIIFGELSMIYYFLVVVLLIVVMGIIYQFAERKYKKSK